MFRKLLITFLHPRAQNEDARRREFILNILLVVSMLFFMMAGIVSFLVSFARPEQYQHNSVSLIILFSTFLLFLILFALSRMGFYEGSAHVLVIVFFLLAFSMGYQWGVDVNASLLIYVLVIVMAGILVSTRFAFFMTGLIAMVLLLLGNLQSTNVVLADRYWRTQPWELSDTIMTVIIFLIIAVVSWLSNREIERTLARAHYSEESLRRERDRLETTVEERTRELKEAQLEKISQLYRFAEFGRLSSGLFHDLMNPLTAVSLNVEKAKMEEETATTGLSRAQEYLDQAFLAAKRMERFIVAVRKQIGKKGEVERFSLQEETKNVIDILSYKAYVSHVELVLSPGDVSMMSGDPVKWSQIMLNLISNGIDAYDDISKEADNRTVTVSFTEDEKTILCTIRDHGSGIPAEYMGKIFEPFFTTKTDEKENEKSKGTGIGLSIVKQMIEKDFHGSITVESVPQRGTTFSILLLK